MNSLCLTHIKNTQAFRAPQIKSLIWSPGFDSLLILRDWSLIMGRGYKTGGGGGHVKFYPNERGGGEFFFSHAEGG